MSNNPSENINQDITAEQRKQDHIELAFKSQVKADVIDRRFYYEPMLYAHPTANRPFNFLGKELNAPMWVSSMTGGTGFAKIINQNLAKACGEYKLGMGLGSCRQLLFEDTFLADFQVRKWVGDQPLYANLGIAQIEELIDNKQLGKIDELLKKLEADGLIIHVNPMQEVLQPEGDVIKHSPIDTIKKVLDVAQYPIIVKEVGQGFGVKSMQALLSLPLAAIDFAASGGTNFALLELLRSEQLALDSFKPLAHIGHDANDMVNILNESLEQLNSKRQCNEVIISGGVKDYLDGYYLTEKAQLPAIYGQASAFLKHARGDYETLAAFVETQIKGYQIAQQFLKIRA